ncbi:sugar-phosphatase [Schleiferilactobacillus shenzhenensis]|uniref:YxeH n=1 Tax=Schleiferilactobacillus shenzhenensis LY-73 TaxID=1231336 RepID=U4TJR2_9LACO|nr:sugar-phosphatase [Schleiferilactobacillus shenzhenensis]ERL64449.1 YxeH [Schleiferilactobacillus shenzhenensis LY-73]
MPTYKIAAVDLDGTLLNEHSQLNPRTIDAVKAAKTKGVHVVICTGRPMTGVRHFLEELDLLGPDDYVITFNGSLVQKTADESVLVRHTLALSDFIDLEYLARKLGSHMHAEDDHFMYTTNKDISPYSVGESYLVQMPIHYRTIDDFAPSKRFSKVMFIDNPDIVEKVSHSIPEEFQGRYHFVRSEPFFLEVLNPNASKGNALKGLAKRLGVPMDQVMAFGDQGNDLSMIEAAGTGIAMANATAEVKAKAQLETASNVDDGVAQMLEKLVLNA